jgi:uncharacterized protein (DUF1800 family)
MFLPAENSWTLFEAAHLLNRAGFGGDPSEIQAFHALGREKAVDSLFAADPPDAFPIPDWAVTENAVAAQQEFRRSIREIDAKSAGLPEEKRAEMRRDARREHQRQTRKEGIEAQAWWFRRLLKTQAPLREKMTLFWHDHFATSLQKTNRPALLMQQNQLFREQAFGNVKKLTVQVLMDPAMLLYLDSQTSKKGQPNENFAREVMELFTLGEGNYTERDIAEAARAFTGYRLNAQKLTVVHQKPQWDNGDKTLFGQTGPFDGKDVIGLIFEQPQAARWIPKKLWEYFVAEDPADAIVDTLAESFKRSGLQTGPLLREIFLSKEFYGESVMRSQIKSPIQYLVEMIKQLEISEPPAGFPLTGQQQLGQLLFMPPNVAGWDWGKGWINTNTLLSRYNLAGFLTKGGEGVSIGPKNGGGIAMRDPQKPKGDFAKKRRASTWDGPDYEKIAPRPLRENPADLVDSLIFRFFQAPLPKKARDSFVEYAAAKKGVIFTDQEVAELTHLILSTPYYQLT